MSFDPVDGSYRGKQPSAIRESIGLGDSLYGINMDNIPKDFLETQDDFKNQKINHQLHTVLKNIDSIAIILTYLVSSRLHNL